MKKPTLEEILNKVCDYYKIKASDVKSQKRKREIVKVRQVFCYLSCKLTKSSLQRIAMYINKKDHGTVLYHENEVEKFISFDEKYKQEIDDILNGRKPVLRRRHPRKIIKNKACVYDNKMKTNEVFKYLLSYSGISQRNFEDLADITHTTTRNCMANRTEMRFSTIERVCLQLGYDVEIKITPKKD